MLLPTMVMNHEQLHTCSCFTLKVCDSALSTSRLCNSLFLVSEHEQLYALGTTNVLHALSAAAKQTNGKAMDLAGSKGKGCAGRGTSGDAPQANKVCKRAGHL